MATTSSELAASGNFTSGKPGRILAGLWRQILKDKQIDNAMLNEKISSYCDSLTQVSVKRRQQIRGNMRMDAFNKEDLTLYTFTKLLRVLGVSKASIEFRFRHIRRTSVHTLHLHLNDDYVLKSKEKETEETSPLGPFLAEIIFNLGIDYSHFETLLDFYMFRSNATVTPESKNDQRAYFRKEFKSPKMSWNSLIKGFIFLCVVDAVMVVELTQAYDYRSLHNYKFSLGFKEDFEELAEDENGSGL